MIFAAAKIPSHMNIFLSFSYMNKMSRRSFLKRCLFETKTSWEKYHFLRRKMPAWHFKKRRQSYPIPSCIVQAVRVHCTHLVWTHSCIVCRCVFLTVLGQDTIQVAFNFTVWWWHTRVHMIWYKKICVFAQKAANWFWNKHCTIDDFTAFVSAKITIPLYIVRYFFWAKKLI